MPTHRRSQSAPFVICWLVLASVPALACGGSGAPTADEPESSAGSEQEVGPSACEGQPLVADLPFVLPEVADALSCSELPTTEPVPPPTRASCGALPREARAACVAGVRDRSRAARPLAEGLAAAGRGDWPLAITKLEAAAVLSSAPDILAELGWHRLLAYRWCDETQDQEDLEANLDSLEPDAAAFPVSELCVRRVSLHQAQEELTSALEEAPPSREHLAAWRLHLAEVALALGDADEAIEAARASICAHDDAAARELLASLLFREGHRLGSEDPKEALARYRESLAVAPNPQRQAFVDQVIEAFEGRFVLQAEAPASPSELFTDVDALCTGLALAGMNEPVEPSELPDDLCELGEWDEVGLARGDDVTVQFHVTTMTVRSPENYDGPSSITYLIARTPRGLNVLLELGSDHGDSRRHNAFVGDIGTSYQFDNPEAPLVVTWDVGESEAYDCTWHGQASRQFSVCALVDGVPRCFAGTDLGPTEYVSDSFLPTVQESLGNCSDGDYAEPIQPEPSEFRPRYDVQVTVQELVATRAEDGAMLCLPLRETLSPLRQLATGR